MEALQIADKGKTKQNLADEYCVGCVVVGNWKGM
jgi:hypothetical protein